MIQGHATPEGTSRFAGSSPADPANYNEFLQLRLSNVGMGTYLGAPDDTTDRAVEGAITESVRRGVNVIDTAINYRSQKAERAVGRALAGLVKDGAIPRDGIFLCTKGGYVTDDADAGTEFWAHVKEQYTDTGIVKPGDITPGYHCMTPRYLADQLDRSLANLGVRCIDLLYLHNAIEGQAGVPRDTFMEQLAKAFAMYEQRRKEGKITYYGMATWECFRVPKSDPRHLALEDVVRMARDAGGDGHGFKFIQLPFNMHYDQALLSKCQPLGGKMVPPLEAASALGLGVFTSVPFMQGRLLQPGVMPEFGSLQPPARALQFVRSAPGVLAPLVGQKSQKHIDENMGIMGVPPMEPDEFAGLVRRLVS